MPNQSMPKNSVWTAMSYTAPRGRCNFKASLMSPACPCLRFMLHPVKAATSFECDGCSHHASFHSMENASDDAVVQKWQAQALDGEGNGQAAGGAAPGKKRRRVVEKADKAANVTASEGENGEAAKLLEGPNVIDLDDDEMPQDLPFSSQQRQHRRAPGIKVKGMKHAKPR